MQGEKDRRFGLHEVGLGCDVRYWAQKETLEKGKDAFSILSLHLKPLLSVKDCFQSRLNIIVFAVLFDSFRCGFWVTVSEGKAFCNFACCLCMSFCTAEPN